MKKVLLAGATGNLGKELLRELKAQRYVVTVLSRDSAKAEKLVPAPDCIIVADAAQPESLRGCCNDIDVIISSLGKSLSLSDSSKGSFQDIDYKANHNLLREAKAAGVQQFIYVSAYSADQHPHLAYFKAHADFANELKSSGMSYIIVEPTALFSVFHEVIAMARKGQVGSLGAGDKLTNPIYEGDVAKVAVQAIGSASRVLPLGGKKVYSRLELMRIACQAAGYKGAIPSVPFPVVELLLPLIKLMKRNLYDKVAFMVAVSKVDCVAPQIGERTLEEYFGLESQKVV